MQTGEVEANLVRLNDKFHLPYIDELIRLKTTSTEKGGIAEKDLAFHRQEFENLQSLLTTAAEKTALPDAPTARPQLHDLLVRLRTK